MKCLDRTRPRNTRATLVRPVQRCGWRWQTFAPFPRHGVDFNGLILPLDCGVCCYLAKTRSTHVRKMELRLCHGIFLGYELKCEYLWGRLYMGADICDLCDLQFYQTTEATSFHRLTMPQCTKFVGVDIAGFRFPLFDRYQQCNETIFGREM